MRIQLAFPGRNDITRACAVPSQTPIPDRFTGFPIGFAQFNHHPIQHRQYLSHSKACDPSAGPEPPSSMRFVSGGSDFPGRQFAFIGQRYASLFFNRLYEVRHRAPIITFHATTNGFAEAAG
jgi:hypothetical protein